VNNLEKLNVDFNSLFRDLVCDRKKEEILQVYLGGLTSETVFSICGELETILRRKKFPKLTIKRTFFLALEIIQNQLLHGSKDEENQQYNYFICTINADCINIYSGNLVMHEEIGSLSERINHVNELLLENTLRNLYMEQLTNDKFSNKGGGGLGFIKMAMVTGNTVQYNFFGESKDYSFLNIDVHLSHSSTESIVNINFDEVLSLLK
jgi:hypothetical protein